MNTKKPKELTFCGECMYWMSLTADEMKKWGINTVLGECRKYAHHPGSFNDGWGKTKKLDWCGEGRRNCSRQ